MPANPPKGMLSKTQLEKMIAEEAIETVLTVFPDMFGRLVGKRITGDYFLNDVLGKAVHACDYLLGCDMEMDPSPGYQFTSWEKGYGDFRMIPDMDTLRVADWLDKTAIVMCDVYEDGADNLVDVAPRSILKKQIAEASTLECFAKGGSELELYIFKDTYEEAAEKQYLDLKPQGRYIEDYHIFQGTKEEFVVGAIRNHMDRSGVPVEFSKGEWGPGQQEINLRYAELLEMADRHAIYKHGAKEIAYLKNCAITFMSKWDERYAGSSFHLHLSLWNSKSRQAVFPGDEPMGPLHSAPEFRWFLGGWMKHLPEIFAFYAPLPTSYKRYAAGSFAPTGVAWSHDNRTTCFRVIGHGDGLRIECRAPGADANPYLAYAMSLAAGLDGIRNKIEPPEMFSGDAYADENIARVPQSLPNAIAMLDNSTWARNTFGDQIIDHYLNFFRVEQRKFDEVVTAWERARYFERI